jgi:hypothetical protein
MIEGGMATLFVAMSEAFGYRMATNNVAMPPPSLLVGAVWFTA